jgi:hypothetical protein
MMRDGKLFIDVISPGAHEDPCTMACSRCVGSGDALHIGHMSFSQLTGRLSNQWTTASAYDGPFPVGNGGPKYICL